MLGDGLAALAIPLLVLDLTRNPLLSALSAASVTVGYLLVGLPAGVLVDRLDPWRVLIAMDAARTLLFAALCWRAPSWPPRWPGGPARCAWWCWPSAPLAGHSQSARASPRRADPGSTDPG